MSPKRRLSAGFTLVEVLISVFILSLFLTGLFFVYRHTTAMYQATAWKQDKLRQVEQFFNLLQKNLEEASNKNEQVLFDISVTEMPLKFRSFPATLPEVDKNGKVLAWKRFRLSSTGTIEYELTGRLSLSDTKVTMQVEYISGVNPVGEVFAPKVVLEDVNGFSINSTQVKLSSSGGEYLDIASTSLDQIIGSILEISIVFTPPKGFPYPGLQITQNHKFRLNVDAIYDSAPDY